MLNYDLNLYGLEPAPPSDVPGHDGVDGSARAERPWHAIACSRAKLYSYRLTAHPVADPLRRYTRAHVHRPVDTEVLRRCLGRFVGAHDFRCFAGAVEQNERRRGMAAGTTDTTRTVFRVDLLEEDAGRGDYRIDFYLKGALYRMVRNMVGTALAVATGDMSEDELLRLLRRGEDGALTRADNLAKPAPPEGLTMEWVYYDDY
mmetsp:Transcript_14287/g.28512  ORF Transcript_14287/g.28512 Transcript_14287/m.28512 type:complete len:203 (+) Transcript_14287:542-1150(+)